MKRVHARLLLSLLAFGSSIWASSDTNEYPAAGDPTMKWVITRHPNGRPYGFAHKVQVNKAAVGGSPITTKDLQAKSAVAQTNAVAASLPTYDTLFTLNVVDQAINPSAIYGPAYYPYSFNHIRVGTDPAFGGASSNIPVVLIPVVIKAADGTVYDPTAHVLPGDDETILSLLKQSPLFQSLPTTLFGNHYGKTQLLDAWVRAERWEAIASNPKYHLLLTATNAVQPLVLTADASQLLDLTGENLTGVERALNLDNVLFVNGVQAYIKDPKNKINPGVIPVFITDYNIYQFFGAGGYHDSLGLQTYIWNGSFLHTSVSEPTIPIAYPRDGIVLEHELAELIDHPFPNYDNGGPCYTYGYEVGDPLEFGQNDFLTVNNKGILYHFQDLTFASYNEGKFPSNAIGQLYSLGGTYTYPCSGL